MRRGEVQAFELLIRRYNQRLFRLARAILASDSEAEDVVQQAYLLAYQQIATFEGRASVGTWITRIAIREATARARQRRVAADAMAGYVADRPEHSVEHEPRRLAEAGELRAAIEGAIDALPRAWRAVFVLRKIDGLGIEECASCLGISQMLVKIRLHRARARLRKLLERRLDDAGVFPTLYRFDGERCNRITSRVMERVR